MTDTRDRQPFEIVGELTSSDLWNPTTFEEWSRQAQTKAFLEAWTAQATHERLLRGRCSWMIFGLATLQTVMSFALIILIGSKVLEIEPILLRILYPCLLTQIFGLFFIMAKYLFAKPFHLDPAAFLKSLPSDQKKGRSMP